jgi:polysaccharide biosynthesis/export protein
MISRTSVLGTIFSICLLAGFSSGFCAGTDTREAPAPAASTNAGSVDSARLLTPNDGISITVYQEDELNTKTIIDKNGKVMLPLLGQIKLSGLSIEQATALIQQLYNKDYLVNPQVNLIVEHFAERRFAVLGQVQRPGSFEFPQNETVNLLEAIAISGGYTRLGSPSKVSVRRIENDAPKIYYFDAAKMAKDTKNKVFEILPNDVINVGERTF